MGTDGEAARATAVLADEAREAWRRGAEGKVEAWGLAGGEMEAAARGARAAEVLERVGRAAGGGAEGAMGAADGAREAAVVAGGVRGEVGAAGGARAVAVLVAAMGRVASRC